MDEKNLSLIISLVKELYEHPAENSATDSTSPSFLKNRLRKIESSLVSIGRPAVPHLIGLLNRRKFPSCIRAAEILGRIGNHEAVPALACALLQEELDETAGKVLQKFGPVAVPHIIDIVRSAVTPNSRQKAPPKKDLSYALITLGAIRCDESCLFLNSLLEDYMAALPPGPFDTEKHEWPYRNIEFFLLLDAMVKQQDERAVPHIRKAMQAFEPEYIDHLVCRIAIGRIKKKLPDGYLPLEALDLSLPVASLMSAFTGKDYDRDKDIEKNYGDLLRAADGSEDGSDSQADKDDTSPSLEEEIESPTVDELIDRYTSTITIEHVIGDHTIEDTLTVPRRRPFTHVFQFKLNLRGIRPAPWRRLQIPESYTFYDFHVAIQDAMNWLDYHLHHFEIPAADPSPGFAVHIECPWFEPWDRDEDWLITTEVKLKDYLYRPKDRALYRYDYGDGWEVDIILEDIFPKQKKMLYPKCLDGALSGPPEDCGGISGYRKCIRAAGAASKLDLGKPIRLDQENEDLLVWLGNWDPDNFNPRLITFESPRSRLKKALA